MQKIIIVGHPFSGYQEVESLLQTCGMQQAQPSRREGFSPQEISTVMAQAHDVINLHQLADIEQIEQIEPSPVWHGMALDLMLGNLNQNVWGWADPQAIFLLDYWRDIDPKITFMLVYDRPHSVLTQLDAAQSVSLTDGEVTEHTRNWYVYNAALLHFFHRNQDRCLLVNSQQVRESVSAYVSKVSARIEAPWSEEMNALLQLDAPVVKESLHGQATSVNVAFNDSPSTFSSENNRSEREVLAKARAEAIVNYRLAQQSTSPLALYVADALVKQHSESVQLYEELQAVADLPQADNGIGLLSPLDAFRALSVQQTSIEQGKVLAAQLRSAKDDVERLAAQKEVLLTEKLRIQRVRTEEEQRSLSSLEKQVAEQLEKIKQEHVQSAQVLTQQLAEQSQKKLTEILAAKTAAEQRIISLESAQQQEGSVTNAASAELQEENDLLLEQLHKVQEELERFYLENQSMKQQAKGKIEPAYYGAADRVKAQLSYRLGAKMIECSRTVSGLLGMPFALRNEARLFQQDAAKYAGQKLAPISKYRDAHEAERVKLHLSYCLGQAMLNNCDSFAGWCRLPWVLKREIKAFRQRRAAHD